MDNFIGKIFLLIFWTCCSVAVILFLCNMGEFLPSCSVERECVDVLVVSADHIPRSVSYIFTGKTTVPVVRSERYCVVVEYDGKAYTFDGDDLYIAYEKYIGCYVEATLEKKIYDNGNITSEIVALGFDENGGNEKMKDLFYVGLRSYAEGKNPLSMSDEEFSVYLSTIFPETTETTCEIKSQALIGHEEEYVELHIEYFSGEFFVAAFADESSAQKYYDENKSEFWDYRANDYGIPVFKTERVFVEEDGYIDDLNAVFVTEELSAQKLNEVK